MASYIAASNFEIKESLLQCRYCQSFIKDPKSLPCLHAYCTTCLQNLMQGKESFNCPQCGDSTKVPPGGVTAFPVTAHLLALADYVKLYMQNDPSISCYNKEYEEIHQDAAVKCMECDVYYCNICDKHHKKSKTAKYHTTIKLTDLKEEPFVKAAQKKVSFCEKHPDSPIEYFCLDQSCQTPSCQRCITVQHKTHRCIELEEKANEFRTSYAKINNGDIAKKIDGMKKLEDKIEDALQELERNHEKNVKEIKEHTQEIHQMADEQEQILLEDEQKHIDESRKYYLEVREHVKDMSTSLRQVQALIQNIASFSPDDELVKQHEEIQKKIDRALQEFKCPELWIQSVSVTSQGQLSVERKQEVMNNKLVKCQNALNESISSLAVFEEMTVAIGSYVHDRPTTLYVQGNNEAKIKVLKERIEKHCPQAEIIVPMVKYGQEKMVIVDHNHIKTLTLDNDDVEDQVINHKPHAITVDDKGTIFYIISTKPAAIKKKSGYQIMTLFTNQERNEILGDPWGMTTNINGDVIVSDANKNSLFIFNKNGELTNTYKDFTPCVGPYPHGVCTCPAGWIYVSDKNGDCIHRLHKTGTFKDYIVTKEDGLSQPTALQWYKGMLVVGQNNGQIKYFKI